MYGTGFRSDRTIAAFDVFDTGEGRYDCSIGQDEEERRLTELAFPGVGGAREGGGPSNVFAVGTYSPASKARPPAGGDRDDDDREVTVLA